MPAQKVIFSVGISITEDGKMNITPSEKDASKVVHVLEKAKQFMVEQPMSMKEESVIQPATVIPG